MKSAEVIFMQEIVREYHLAKSREKSIKKEVPILKKELLSKSTQAEKKFISKKIISLEREQKQAYIFCKLVDDVLENIKSDSTIDDQTYGIFHHYLFINSNQMRASKEFNLTQDPGSKRIRLCSELFVYYWEYPKRKQPLSISLPTLPNDRDKLSVKNRHQ